MQAGLNNSGTVYGLSSAKGDEQRSGEIMWSKGPLPAEMSETSCLAPLCSGVTSAQARTCARSGRLAAASWIRALFRTGYWWSASRSVQRPLPPAVCPSEADAACLSITSACGERVEVWHTTYSYRAVYGLQSAAMATTGALEGCQRQASQDEGQQSGQVRAAAFQSVWCP